VNHEKLPRRTAADTTDDVSRVLGKLEESGQDLTILKILANNPTMFRPFIMMANALVYKATLPVDVRETVVLWIAQHLKNTYEWSEHVPMAKRAGLNDEQIAGIREGDLSASTDDQRFAVELTRQLLTDRAIAPDTWQGAVERWEVEGTMDLVLSIGWWSGLVPAFLDALGLDLPDAERAKL
jgi:alkylhydroperoxidase family enzyme